MNDRIISSYILLCLTTCLLVESLSKERNCPWPSPMTVKHCSCKWDLVGLTVLCEKITKEQLPGPLDRVNDTNLPVMHLVLKNIPFYHFSTNLLHLEVRILEIRYCNLSSVDKDAFTPTSKTLETLDLSFNEFKRVPSQSLKNLNAVKYLSLNNNSLELLHRDAFLGLNMLRHLSLVNNRIKFIHEMAFRSLSLSLSHIELSSNKLTVLPCRSLRSLTGLEELELQSNFIHYIEECGQERGSFLKSLKLFGNRINVLPPKAFYAWRGINNLVLERNFISRIDKQAFFGIEDSLRFLNLGFNRLKSIPSSSIRNFTDLQSLDLTDNDISNVRDDDFVPYGKTLQLLFLRSNRIKSVPSEALVHLESIKYLHLEYNNIHTFSNETYSCILNTLRHLYLEGNPVNCDCKIRWLLDWFRKEPIRMNIAMTIRCSSPKYHQDVPLNNLSSSQLSCHQLSSSGYSKKCYSFFSIATSSLVLLSYSNFFTYFLQSSFVHESFF